ncbi:hypothetical protein [Lapillicoccus sp.]|uniref:hypothetical protein n=1 Tax=Lapillicoccus sp. TaxID=1909287 RepID=UPI0025F434C8|nr:hypothetical protein [Lapillicoccus sp.]
MDEVQGADGVMWTWGAPSSARGGSIPRAFSVASEPVAAAEPAPSAPGSGDDADLARAEALRAEEEWFAAGLTVCRPTPPPETEVPVLEAPAVPVDEAPLAVEAPPVAAASGEPAQDLPPGGTPDEVARAEQEWEAAGLTVRRPILPIERLEPLLEPPPEEPRHEEPVAIEDPGPALAPQDENDDGYEGRHHAAEEHARALRAAEDAAGERAGSWSDPGSPAEPGLAFEPGPVAEPEPVGEMLSEGAPVTVPDPVPDAGPTPETVVPQPGSSNSPDRAEGWNGPQGGPQWEQQAQPTPGQWPGQEPWPHDGGLHPESAEQAWQQQPTESPAVAPDSAAEPAAQQPTGQVWDPRQQRWVQPEPAHETAYETAYETTYEPLSAAATTPAAQGVDPAYTWRGERGELYVWDGYQWVLQPASASASPLVPEQVSAQPQAAVEHTWDGPNGEYWVWDGYQWVQRARPVAAASAGGPTQVATWSQQPAEVTPPEHTWVGPNGEYWVWDGYQWVQRERPAVTAQGAAVQTWTGDDGQVWEWDPAGSQWHRRQPGGRH